jgi:hypothetical protein
LKQVSDLHFRHFSTSVPGRHGDVNEACFELWEKIWLETFDELQVKHKQVTSDDYLSKELGGLFLGDKPVGFLLYHFCDLGKRTHQKMSYFHNYPEDLYRKVIGQGDQAMVITYMTLDHAWRKSQTNVPISELLIGFAVMRFMESQAKRLLGYFRNNRGTQNMFYRHGGQPLLLGSHAYNVEVDFAEITRSTARLSEWQACADLTFRKWHDFKTLEQGDKHHDRVHELERNETARPVFPGHALDKLGVL